jgi:hypothetical protein
MAAAFIALAMAERGSRDDAQRERGCMWRFRAGREREALLCGGKLTYVWRA